MKKEKIYFFLTILTPHVGEPKKSPQGFGKFHPGFRKIPPRVLENYQICTRRGTICTFLDKQVSEEKLKNGDAMSR